MTVRVRLCLTASRRCDGFVQSPVEFHEIVPPVLTVLQSLDKVPRQVLLNLATPRCDAIRGTPETRERIRLVDHVGTRPSNVERALRALATAAVRHPASRPSALSVRTTLADNSVSYRALGRVVLTLPSSWRFVATAIAAIGGLALTTSPAQAQQNLFNVPSGHITDLGNVFFQEQFNFNRPIGSSNTTFDFGLGHGWEVGFNALDFNFYENIRPLGPGERRQVNPDLLLNAQKTFEVVADLWSIGVGTQIGFNPSRLSRNVQFQNFTWVINGFEFPDEWGKLYFGAYYANVAYAGPGDRFGVLMGIEVPVIKDRFHFQADLITGSRDISVAVVGGVLIFPNKWQLSFGAQLPTPHSGNPYGAVIEFTIPGYPLFSRHRD